MNLFKPKPFKSNLFKRKALETKAPEDKAQVMARPVSAIAQGRETAKLIS
jgi:hypothetical protein